MTTVENWKPVVGYEGAYEVSDLGRVRGLDRHVPVSLASGAPCLRRVRGTYLKPGMDSAGYASVALQGSHSIRVHWLVLGAFAGPCPEGLHRLHNNGDKTDNSLANLRYGTRSENMIDLFAHGHRKLTREQVLTIRAAKARGLARGEKKLLAAAMGVSLSTIQDVIRGRSYAHVR